MVWDVVEERWRLTFVETMIFIELWKALKHTVYLAILFLCPYLPFQKRRAWNLRRFKETFFVVVEARVERWERGGVVKFLRKSLMRWDGQLLAWTRRKERLTLDTYLSITRLFLENGFEGLPIKGSPPWMWVIVGKFGEVKALFSFMELEFGRKYPTKVI